MGARGYPAGQPCRVWAYFAHAGRFGPSMAFHTLSSFSCESRARA